MAANLSRHLADETRHAWLWTERILEIGGEPQKLDDGYQVRLENGPAGRETWSTSSV